MPLTAITGIVSISGQIFNLFKGSAEKRKATNQSVCAFWDPILGTNNYPQKFQSWLWAVYRKPKSAALRLSNMYKIAETLMRQFPKEQILADVTVSQEIKNLVTTMEILPGGEFFYKNGILGTRNANRGASLTNDIIEGNQKIWGELAEVLGDKMPDIGFWSNYLGWGEQIPEADLHSKGTGSTENFNLDNLENPNNLLLLAGALLLIKLL